jgi:uncharacterized protein
MFKLIIFFLLFILLNISLYSQEVLPQKPESWVTDDANVLSGIEKRTLTEMLSSLEKRSSNQIFIAIFKQLPQGYYLEDFAVKLYDKWRPGLADKDNGVLIVAFIEDRKIRIEVGYGLEDVITDLQAGRIIQYYIAPQFKEGNYYQGFRDALQVLIPVVEGKYQLPQNSADKEKNEGISLVHIFIGLFLLMMIYRIFKGPHSTGFGTRRRGTFFPIPFPGGGRSSGGFGGGGFSGGFGGLSGGGGASGSW